MLVVAKKTSKSRMTRSTADNASIGVSLRAARLKWAVFFRESRAAPTMWGEAVRSCPRCKLFNCLGAFFCQPDRAKHFVPASLQDILKNKQLLY